MYVTSASDGMDKEWLSRQPQAGGVFKVNNSFSFRFRGPFFSLLHLGSRTVGVVGSRKRVVVKISVIYAKLLFIFLVPVAGQES